MVTGMVHLLSIGLQFVVTGRSWITDPCAHATAGPRPQPNFEAVVSPSAEDVPGQIFGQDFQPPRRIFRFPLRLIKRQSGEKTPKEKVLQIVSPAPNKSHWGLSGNGCIVGATGPGLPTLCVAVESGASSRRVAIVHPKRSRAPASRLSTRRL